MKEQFQLIKDSILEYNSTLHTLRKNEETLNNNFEHLNEFNSKITKHFNLTDCWGMITYNGYKVKDMLQ